MFFVAKIGQIKNTENEKLPVSKLAVSSINLVRVGFMKLCAFTLKLLSVLRCLMNNSTATILCLVHMGFTL